MKHLLTTDNGGFPLNLDDLRWIESGNVESLAAIGGIFGPTFAAKQPVLTFVPVGATLEATHTAGVVFADGEFSEIAAITTPVVATTGQTFYWEKIVVADPAGLKVFQNTVSHDTYLNNVWRLQSGASIPSGALPLTTFIGNGLTQTGHGLLLNKMLDLPFSHNDHVLFHNSSTAETCSGSGDDGFVQFNNERANAYVVEFTSPVSGIYAMQNSGSSYSGAWRLIKFVGTSGSTEMKIVHQSATSAGTLYKFKCPNGHDVLVRTGDVCLFWNDGTDWILASGGRPIKKTLSYLSGWGTQIGFTGLGYKKNNESFVKLEGQTIHASFTPITNALIAILPVKYRPASAVVIPIVNIAPGTSDTGVLTISPNGEINVNFFGTAPFVNAIVSFDSVSFYASEI